PAPKIRITTPRKVRPQELAAIGDRVLLRIEALDEEGPIRHEGRVIKVLDRARHRILGIFRASPAGGGRLVPVDKKALGREMSVPTHATGDAQDGELVAADIAKQGRYGLPVAHVKERLGSLKSERTVSL